MNDRSFFRKQSITGKGLRPVLPIGVFGSLGGVLCELKNVSWVPEQGLKYLVRLVLCVICVASVSVYFVDLFTDLFIRGLSVIIGAFF